MAGSLLVNWILFLVSLLVLAASVIMLWNRKGHPLIGTSLLVIGLTLMLVFGTPDLLQRTIETFTK